MRPFITILIAALAAFAAVGTAGAGEREAFSALANHQYERAMQEFRKMADQGDDRGQYNLAAMYKNGKGVAPDYAEAFKWYRLAAGQGHRGAQFNVATMYLAGQGVAQDPVQAYLWAELAFKAGVTPAQAVRDMAASSLTPVQLAAAQQLVNEWQPATK